MRISFSHQSIRDAMAAPSVAAVMAREGFARFAGEAWEESVVLTLESPQRLEEFAAGLSHPSRNVSARATYIMQRVARSEHLPLVLKAVVDADFEVSSQAGYIAVRLLETGGDTERKLFLDLLRTWACPDGPTEEKLKAMRLARNVGLAAGDEVIGCTLGLLSDVEPLVRCYALHALNGMMAPRRFLKHVRRVCHDSIPMVRGKALQSFLQQAYHLRSDMAEPLVVSMVDEFRANYTGVEDRINLAFWLSQFSTIHCHTDLLVDWVLDTDNDPLVRWQSARSLCCFPHSRNLSLEQREKLAALSENQPLQNVLREVLTLAAIQATPGTITRDWLQRVAASNQVVMRQLVSRLHRFDGAVSLDRDMRELWQQYVDLYSSIWTGEVLRMGQLLHHYSLVYQFYTWTPEQQEIFILFLLQLVLRPEASEEEETAHCVANFLRDVGSSDERLCAARTLIMESALPHFRSGVAFYFTDSHRAIPHLLMRAQHDLHPPVSTNGAIVLQQILGNAGLPFTLSMLHDSPTSWARALILCYLPPCNRQPDLENIVVQAFSHDPDPNVRVRALRVFESVGYPENRELLKVRFDDTARARWGTVGDVAREVYRALAGDVSSDDTVREGITELDLSVPLGQLPPFQNHSPD